MKNYFNFPDEYVKIAAIKQLILVIVLLLLPIKISWFYLGNFL